MANIRSVIEFGTSKIICLIDQTSIKGMDLPGSSCIRYAGIKNHAWVNRDGLLDALEQAVEAAEKKCGKQVRSTVVGVPAGFMHVATREISHDMSAGVVTMDVVRNMAETARPKNEKGLVLVDVRPVYFLDDRNDLYVEIPLRLRTRTLKAMFSYCYAYKFFVSDVNDMADKLRISIDRYLPEPRSLALSYIPENARNASAVLVDVGYTQTSISAVFKDAVLGVATVPMGGESFVEDLMKSLRIDSITAESLKRSHTFGLSVNRNAKVYGKNQQGRMVAFDQVFVKRIIEARFYDIAQEIDATIQLFHKKKMISRNARVFLTGAGAAMKGSEIFLQNCLSRYVYIALPKGNHAFTPVYNTALSLLDNEDEAVYDLSLIHI